MRPASIESRRRVARSKRFFFLHVRMKDGRRGRTPAATSSRTGYLRFHQTYDDLFCFLSKGWMRRSVMRARATHSSPPRGSILTSRYFHERSFTSMRKRRFFFFLSIYFIKLAWAANVKPSISIFIYCCRLLATAAARVFTCVCCSSIGDRSRARVQLPTVNTPGSPKAPASCTSANARLESITRQNNPRDFQSKPLSHHTSLADSDLPNVTYTTCLWQKNKLIFSALLATIDEEARGEIYWGI
uniref:Uncharacterized protein n=1 Tax=Trichogramma kaykai TaxID=54128 RepID=A0ABD2WW88_9HYME